MRVAGAELGATPGVAAGVATVEGNAGLCVT